MKNLLFVLFAVLLASCSPDKVEINKAASSVANIENIDDGGIMPAVVATMSNKKCPCENLPILTGSRGGHYCVRTSKNGNQYKSYLKKGVKTCQ